MGSVNSTTEDPVGDIYNAEAEAAVIGGVLIQPALIRSLHFLVAEDFFLNKNQEIWAAITRLSEQNLDIDSVLVRSVAPDMHSSYLEECITLVPTALHTVSYARVVKGCSIRRRTIQLLAQAAGVLLKDQHNVAAILERLLVRINELLKEYQAGGEE